MIYLELFWSFFQVGLFSIGGGYAAMPLIQQQVVEQHNWLTMTEFANVIAISQMTPGPIGINSATFVGTQIAGLSGALVATLGCVLPSFIIVLAITFLYYKYRNVSFVQGALGSLRPAVVAMIASAGISILVMSLWNTKPISLNINDFDFIALGIFIVSLFILRKFKLNPIAVMGGAGVVGLIIYSFI